MVFTFSSNLFPRWLETDRANLAVTTGLASVEELMARRGKDVYVLADSSKLGLRPSHQ